MNWRFTAENYSGMTEEGQDEAGGYFEARTPAGSLHRSETHDIIHTDNDTGSGKQNICRSGRTGENEGYEDE